ncbi:MAG: CoA transferase [Pseudomonadales bacterium]|nr:CoA transferase [Pseudomonadales bacterium]MCP5182568.1 CoA transferase [Pseudomonadales bacterium]
MSGPLADLTIIDCTMALAGPYGTALLADLGANVIKVEPPGGDGSRSLPPLPPDYANAGPDNTAGVDYGGYFASINRNKRSIVLDLKQAADRELLLSMSERADAMVENMRVGVMDRLGVGYEAVAARNPRIVYGAIRGFGDPRTGVSPYAEWPAYDIVAQSMGGHAHITGPAGGGGYPGGVSAGDIYPGTLLALGVVAAIHNARTTGTGQFFDVGMMDAMIAFSETVIVNYGYNGTELGARGQHHPSLMPFGIFPAKDGSVAIAAPGPGHWAALCEAMGTPQLIDDPRSRNTHLRKRNQAFVEGVITGWTSARTKQEIMQAIGGKVPCGPVNTASEIFADPHVAARNMITRFQLPGDNPEVAIAGTPLKFATTPGGFRRPPPRLGEHSEEILAEFGLSRCPDP